MQMELDFEPEQLELGLEIPETPNDGVYIGVWGWDPWGVAPTGYFCVFAVEPLDSGPVICVFKFLANAQAYADRWRAVQGGEATVYNNAGKAVYRVVAPDDAPPSDYTCTVGWELEQRYAADRDDPIPFG